MKRAEKENIEIELLLEAIFNCYGYDFRHYSRATLKRRIKHFLSKTGYGRITEMIPQLIYDNTFFESMANNFSITVTEMFRDPLIYQTIRSKIVPYLKTYPFIRIWHAGCATGEEVYSMAILLKEEGLYDRSRIYATDFNENALIKAKEGIYSIDKIKQHTKNYQESGGKKSFSEYYYSQYDSVIMKSELKKNITFAEHNLATDFNFGEMHFVLCRNVLIYFDKTLQNRVLKLFCDSLVINGFLCLGSKESLMFSDVIKNFKEITHEDKIYQKKLM